MNINQLTFSVLTYTLITTLSACSFTTFSTDQSQGFNGEYALEYVEKQVSFGPRTPGSISHQETINWITKQLVDFGWDVEIQEAIQLGHPVRNIIARRTVGEPYIIIGAHYDSRLIADNDPIPANQILPVPGANDGASGTATLLELARTLPDDIPINTWLVFFDAEDNGNIQGWDWILGSSAFVEKLDHMPEAVVIVDMIGDADLQVYMERNSDPLLTQAIWDKAAQLGYEDLFIPEINYGILDDHSPFLSAGIPAALIIDFDYPYWHTVNDTVDKISGDSLQVVGDVILAWLTQLQ